VAHLILIGPWEQSLDALVELAQAGHLITWAWCVAPPAISGDLLLVRLDQADRLPSGLPSALPWLAWNVTDNAELTLAAYAAKAAVVLPAATPASLLRHSVDRLLPVQTRATQQCGECAARRSLKYRAGDLIQLPADSVLEIETGIVAQTVIHPDGAEVLLGLHGAGQLLTPHPDDSCLIQLVAHTATVLTLQPWALASQKPTFAERLRARLWQMEAWAAMQARPYLADRLLGILSLLAEQFGKPQADGMLIDVRITHAQLATAIGANRTTITRLLSELRRRALLTTVGHGQDERFCLLEWRQSHHDFLPSVAIATLR
jgi:CRP-like cAMP-binding protein